MSRPLKNPEQKIEKLVNDAIKRLVKLQGLADRGYVNLEQCDVIRDAINKETNKMKLLSKIYADRQLEEGKFKL